MSFFFPNIFKYFFPKVCSTRACWKYSLILYWFSVRTIVVQNTYVRNINLNRLKTSFYDNIPEYFYVATLSDDIFGLYLSKVVLKIEH